MSARPLVEPARFTQLKKIDAWLYERGRRHVFELVGIRRAAQAGDLIRKLAEASGLSKLDDLLDEVRISSIIKSITSRLGIP